MTDDGQVPKLSDPSVWDGEDISYHRPVTFNLGYAFPMGYAKRYKINKNESQVPLEPWTSSDRRTNEDSYPNWGAGMSETILIISLTGQNDINNLQNI
jgi:hypothetical protein